jgi:hypothetical protein
MTAPTLGGNLHILRPEAPGRALKAYNRLESHRFLRIGSAHGGSSLLGIFNIGDKRRMEVTTASAFQPALAGDGAWLAKSHVANRIELLPDREAFTSIVLAPKEYEIITAILVVPRAGFKFAALGLLGKMTGIAALLEKPTTAINEHGALSIRMALKTTGVIGIFLLYLWCTSIVTNTLLGIWLEDAEQYVQKDLIRAVYHVQGQRGDFARFQSS